MSITPTQLDFFNAYQASFNPQNYHQFFQECQRAKLLEDLEVSESINHTIPSHHERIPTHTVTVSGFVEAMQRRAKCSKMDIPKESLSHKQMRFLALVLFDMNPNVFIRHPDFAIYKIELIKENPLSFLNICSLCFDSRHYIKPEQKRRLADFVCECLKGPHCRQLWWLFQDEQHAEKFGHLCKSLECYLNSDKAFEEAKSLIEKKIKSITNPCSKNNRTFTGEAYLKSLGALFCEQSFTITQEAINQEAKAAFLAEVQQSIDIKMLKELTVEKGEEVKNIFISHICRLTPYKIEYKGKEWEFLIDWVVGSATLDNKHKTNGKENHLKKRPLKEIYDVLTGVQMYLSSHGLLMLLKELVEDHSKIYKEHLAELESQLQKSIKRLESLMDEDIAKINSPREAKSPKETKKSKQPIVSKSLAERNSVKKDTIRRWNEEDLLTLDQLNINKVNCLKTTYQHEIDERKRKCEARKAELPVKVTCPITSEIIYLLVMFLLAPGTFELYSHDTFKSDAEDAIQLLNKVVYSEELLLLVEKAQLTVTAIQSRKLHELFSPFPLITESFLEKAGTFTRSPSWSLLDTPKKENLQGSLIKFNNDSFEIYSQPKKNHFNLNFTNSDTLPFNSQRKNVPRKNSDGTLRFKDIKKRCIKIPKHLRESNIPALHDFYFYSQSSGNKNRAFQVARLAQTINRMIGDSLLKISPKSFYQNDEQWRNYFQLTQKITNFVALTILQSADFKTGKRTTKTWIGVVKQLDSAGNIEACSLVVNAMHYGPVKRVIRPFRSIKNYKAYFGKNSPYMPNKNLNLYVKKMEDYPHDKLPITSLIQNHLIRASDHMKQNPHLKYDQAQIVGSLVSRFKYHSGLWGMQQHFQGAEKLEPDTQVQCHIEKTQWNTEQVIQNPKYNKNSREKSTFEDCLYKLSYGIHPLPKKVVQNNVSIVKKSQLYWDKDLSKNSNGK